MRIIKRGEIPGDRVHELTCSTCHTVFEAQEREMLKMYNQREGDWWEIDCPVCDRKVYHFTSLVG